MTVDAIQQASLNSQNALSSLDRMYQHDLSTTTNLLLNAFVKAFHHGKRKSHRYHNGDKPRNYLNVTELDWQQILI